MEGPSVGASPGNENDNKYGTRLGGVYAWRLR